MTDPSYMPSEAEVEAAADKLAETAGGNPRLWVRHARAALTAAAQVRERAVSEAHKRDRPCVICAGTGRFGIGYRCYACKGSGKAVDNYEHPSTEPDSGPDVLGERKE